ncbi:MAG: Heimdall-CTERM domain-containing surface protein [Candidatus Hodarchaeales archaeon]|jgi:hypothetical protein
MKLGGLSASASGGVPGFELLSTLLIMAVLPILKRKIGNRG